MRVSSPNPPAAHPLIVPPVEPIKAADQPRPAAPASSALALAVVLAALAAPTLAASEPAALPAPIAGAIA